MGYSAHNPITGYSPRASESTDLKAHEGVG